MSRGQAARAIAFGMLPVLAACRATPDTSAPTPPVIVTDAMRYTVLSFDEGYSTTIEYHMRNTTGVVLSRAGCGAPPPVLEKNVGDQWIMAYSPIVFPCLTIPHFYIAPDSNYRATYRLSAGKRGSRFFPQFDVEPIPGTYRLRWALSVGPDPESPSAPTIYPISNEFQLVFD